MWKNLKSVKIYLVCLDSLSIYFFCIFLIRNGSLFLDSISKSILRKLSFGHPPERRTSHLPTQFSWNGFFLNMQRLFV